MENSFENYNRHYIRTDANSNITEGWSDGPHRDRTPTEDDILLTDKGGYQFRLTPGGQENPPLRTFDGIPLYRWDGENVIQRSEEEIEADRVALRKTKAKAERERINNATETVLLEMVAEQEERICCLEMGVNPNDL